MVNILGFVCQGEDISTSSVGVTKRKIFFHKYSIEFKIE